MRAKVSDDRVNSFTEHIATVEDKTPISELISEVSIKGDMAIMRNRGIIERMGAARGG